MAAIRCRKLIAQLIWSDHYILPDGAKLRGCERGGREALSELVCYYFRKHQNHVSFWEDFVTKILSNISTQLKQEERTVEKSISNFWQNVTLKESLKWPGIQGLTEHEHFWEGFMLNILFWKEIRMGEQTEVASAGIENRSREGILCISDYCGYLCIIVLCIMYYCVWGLSLWWIASTPHRGPVSDDQIWGNGAVGGF